MAQDPAVEVAVEEAPKPKSKKKLIIILSAVLVLAAGGGGAAWYFMHQKSDHPKEAKEAKEEVAPKEPVFVKLETFTVNLNPEDGEKFLQVDITLNATSKEESEFLEQQMPQVRNRVLMLLTSKKASDISSMEGKKLLSQEIGTQINQPFTPGGKPPKISGVFFTSFVIQ